MARPAPVCLLAAVACLALASGALAQERILRFYSDITINPDASLLVTETIDIYAEGVGFRRGILRDFPTVYENGHGNKIKVGFEVEGVLRDGQREPYRTERLSNGVRLRIGDAKVFLERGPHRYAITYRTTRQLGFFDTFDELYWNVTGTGWEFAIDEVEARVRLPGAAQAVQHTAYTGAQGARGTDFESFERAGIWTFRTTRGLAAREGLTIAIAWPKGFVAEPTAAERARWFLGDNSATGLAIAGTGILLLYYSAAWRRFGRDPETGTIIPRFEPPPGLSAAATRFIRMMGFDQTGFSAALIDMAVKGYVVIASEGDTYRLHKQPGADARRLSAGEHRIAQALFGEASILLDNENHRLLRKSIRQLRNSLRTEHEKAHFERNTGLFLVGLVLSVLVLGSTAATDADPAVLPRALVMTLGSAVLVYLALHFLVGDDDPTFRARPFRRPPARIVVASLQVLVFALIMAGNVAGAAALDLFANPLQSLCFALLGSLNVIFFFLLKRPTLAGRKIMDEIEGFRMYLGTAEEHRLNLLNPPDKTPELFEKYLPYALALDLENEWSEKFARILLLASMAPGESAYRPRWYRGGDWQPGNASAFTRRLGRSLGTAVAASTTAPGSSSGSGGGGFSGGGGGGGGGGGW